MSITDNRRGLGYYAERLLSQAISDPKADALDRAAVRQYIEQEAAKLCLPPEKVADKAMRGYEQITTGDFNKATHHRRSVIQ